MASRKTGLLLGCLLVAAMAAVVLVSLSIFVTAPWMGGEFPLIAGGKVGLVVLEGPIGPSRGLVQELEANRRDPAIKAVVLRVDSPGGEVAPSQEIHGAVLRLAREKPVVASFGSVAASGGYYAAVGADSILADAGTLTGSIGVIFSYPTAEHLLDKVGVQWQTYKSGALKDMGTFTREPTEEEEEVFDGLVSDVYDQFVTAVVQGRGLDRDRVLAMADGRVFTGRQAVELGLVDGIGDLHAAVNMAARMAGLPEEPPVVRKTRPKIPILDVIEQFLGDNARSASAPRLEYRWR
jgi:protease-4